VKTKLILLMIVVALASAAQVWAKAVLPDACGDDKVRFDVKTKKDQSAPAGPEAGKAQLVLIEIDGHLTSGFGHATVRFGVDGAWAGANKGDSYFVLSVPPGEHHLCVNWEGNREIGVAAFTAEPGKVYYFAAQLTTSGSGGGGIVAPPAMAPNGTWSDGERVSGTPQITTFYLRQLTEDDGKYRVKAGNLSTSTPK